jgi:protein TonB
VSKRPRLILSTVKWTLHQLVMVVGAVAFTFVFFLVLPLMQAINKPPISDVMVHDVAVTDTPPPPPPPEEKPPEEPEKPEEPPKLAEDNQPLDLSQLELALNPTFGSGALAGDFAVKLNAGESGGGGVDALFNLSDLDQRPRVMYQPGPTMTPQIRKLAPGTVYIIFIVDESGRVVNPMVQKSTAPVFEAPALKAVKQWKFEPGKKNGKAVRFRMRVPITFPKG